ncbi:MAG: type VII toxin-antitoxin system HepT family RNase toxin [Thermodesulfobacteriota bacterium]
MGMIDKEKVKQYEAEIKEALNVLTQITSSDMEDFIRDDMKIRAMKYTIIVLAEAICNLNRHILAKKAWLVVEEYIEAILKMQEKGFLSQEIANSLIPLIKLRHQLIHGYWKTDDRRLFAETKNNLNTVNLFIKAIEKIISDS